VFQSVGENAQSQGFDSGHGLILRGTVRHRTWDFRNLAHPAAVLFGLNLDTHSSLLDICHSPIRSKAN
jgi:hypothetical protein